jgi:hypothetical protein
MFPKQVARNLCPNPLNVSGQQLALQRLPLINVDPNRTGSSHKFVSRLNDM